MLFIDISNNPSYDIFHLFAENIRAQKSTWFVADIFLKEIFDTYTSMRDKALHEQKVKGKNQAKVVVPYMYHHYNVERFTTGNITSMSSSPLARILNNLIEAVNEYQILSRFIVIVPDLDILKSIKHYDYGVSKIIGSGLEWLVQEIDRLITTKKIDLARIWPGVVIASEPKVIWITMMGHPQPSRILALRKKFNAILEETLFGSRGMNIANLQLELRHEHFDRSNYLMAEGRIYFWKNIDKLLEKFDLHKIELIPRPIISEGDRGRPKKGA